MVTKWKNKIGFLTGLFFTIGLIGIFILLKFSNQYLLVNYFESNNFTHEKNEIWSYISRFEIYDIPKEEAKSNLIVTNQEIEVARSELGDLQSQQEQINVEYGYEIDAAKAENNTSKVEQLTKERDEKLEKMRAYFEDDNYTKEQLLKKKEKELNAYYEEQENMKSIYEQYKETFAFYLENKESGEVITNLSGIGEEFFIEENMFYIEDWDYSLTPIGPPGIPLEDQQLVGKIGVMKDAPKTFIMYNYYEFLKYQKIFYGYLIGGLVSLIVGFILFSKVNISRTNEIGRRILPIDLHAVLTIIGIILTFIVLNDQQALSTYIYVESVKRLIMNFVILFLVVGATTFFVKFLLTRVQDANYRIMDIKRSILYKWYQAGKEAFLNRKIGTQTLLLVGVVVAFIPTGIWLARRFYYMPITSPTFILYMFLFIVLALPTIYLIVKRAGYFTIILENTSELVKGNDVPDLDVRGGSPLAKLASNINELKSGVELSQKEQLKSERLKTELITNVSHDLRTPLTSIINYTELLKKSDITEEERNSYVEIIDRKSKRLKVLIEDLFEASKMASGNIELERTKIDIRQLLEQALAEHEEKIKESTLQFRVSTPDSPVYANVDGQKVWRVFDNLIGNILKYSLENTRVYVQVKSEKGKSSITFKNVTKYELGENVDELFERFKRGDTSRHTEGSGLGLAIAKSIVDLHHGDMEIELDGDLFKVTVHFDSVSDRENS